MCGLFRKEAVFFMISCTQRSEHLETHIMATSEPSEGVKPTGAGPVVAQPQPQNPSSSNASQSRQSTRKMRYNCLSILHNLYHCKKSSAQR